MNVEWLMIRHEMCLMKRDHVGGENMISKEKVRFISSSITKMEDTELIAELLYRSFKIQNEKKFRKMNEPKLDQKSANKMISQRYQNVSMKRGINKSALYCGKVKF